MSWLAILAWATFGIAAFFIARWVDPFDDTTVGVERFVQRFIWLIRYFVVIIFLFGTVWIIWLKLTGQI